NVRSVAISADGKYITAGSNDESVYTFKNSLADRPSVIPYGPRSGSEDVTDPILRWFAGSDDRSNLTFDVYLDTSSSPTTLVADDTSALSYTPSGLVKNTKYYWKVIATDPSGSTTSSVMNFTVLMTPEWSYNTGDDIEQREAAAISADGEYIVGGSIDNKIYLFDRDSSTPLWSYTTGNQVHSVSISADGEYIVAGSHDDKVYLLERVISGILCETPSLYGSSIQLSWNFGRSYSGNITK
ncbi:MAG: hypothetical protein QGH00_05110, partial [Candidatus Poseidoniia archaeon]|nr:hypothetical protein [Candidatus Poseidoniia archaeon]